MAHWHVSHRGRIGFSWPKAQSLANTRVPSTGASTAVLIIASFAAPLILATLFFPTPNVDMREHANWGLQFPLATWKHPPLQTWLTGMVAAAGGRDGWAFTLAAQALNLVGLWYMVQITRRFIDRDAAVEAAVAFCGTVFTLIYPFKAGLNADQIQIPLWLGLLHHALAAAAEDRWRDWVAAGAFAAAAMLAKFFGFVLLVALGAVFLTLRSHRACLLRPGPYVAAAIASTALPFVWLTLQEPGNLEYSLDFVAPRAALVDRAEALVALAFGLLCAAPYGFVLIVAAARDGLEWRTAPSSARPVVAVAMITAGLLLAMILLLGLRYQIRFTAPLLPLLLLSAITRVRVRPQAIPAFARLAALKMILFLCGAAGYAATIGHLPTQEPSNGAALDLRQEWERHFACGPAYVFGDKISAHAIGLYFGGKVIGASPDDLRFSPWVHPDRARAFGSIVVEGTRKMPPGAFQAIGFDPTVAPRTLTLPQRGLALRPRLYTYRYWFVPPAECGASR